tara:strand:- start:3086 stop:3265 length:180 start_codon:yes stop_codon:yes gene_type:complete
METTKKERSFKIKKDPHGKKYIAAFDFDIKDLSTVMKELGEFLSSSEFDDIREEHELVK